MKVKNCVVSICRDFISPTVCFEVEMVKSKEQLVKIMLDVIEKCQQKTLTPKEILHSYLEESDSLKQLCERAKMAVDSEVEANGGQK